MKINVYINTQGARIGIKNNQLYASIENQTIKTWPIKLIEIVFIFGNIYLTTQAIKTFLREAIPVIFLSYLGDYIGHLSSIDNRNYRLKYFQFNFFSNKSHRLQLINEMLVKKWKLEKSFLTYAFKNQKKERKLVDNFKNQVVYWSERLIRVKKFNEILGIEGRLKREYYHLLSQLVLKSDFYFHKRSKYPPKDRFNSLLSFGYTLLANLITGVLYAYNLDPYIGFYHENRYCRPNLALDILEFFRWEIDRLVLKLVNLEVIKKDDFEDINSRFLLSKDGIKKFIENYEKEIISSDKIKAIEKIIKSLIAKIYSHEKTFLCRRI